MSVKIEYKVRVLFRDGSLSEFYAGSTYDLNGEGKMCVWQDVSINGGTREDYYSIPTDLIKEIKESEVG